MSATTRRALAAVAVSLALSVVVSSTARANGGPPTRLDKGTASVLAENMGVYWGEDAVPKLRRCIRVGALRADCVVEYFFEFDEFSTVEVRVVELVGRLLFYADYDVEPRTRYTKANSIRVSPPGFKIRPIAHSYRGYGRGSYQPRFLMTENVGWGRPELPQVILAQCAFQPRLPCAGNFR
ncbi:MAG TPA: hypothetical protein VD866_28030 [Urbifossiella sp.]|nr:hypothetical protein [Urbifossiella sp.]